MAIDIDYSTRLLGDASLEALIHAVAEANPNDEARWLEWKSDLELGTREHLFKIAKGILGLANRTAEQAETWAEGYGYLLVGVEPGRISGLEAIDISKVESKLRSWVGGGLRSPRWTASWVGVDGATVLVAEVSPPEPGDPLFPLRQTYEKFREGTVFVRRQASSDPADAEEILHLSERAAGRQRLRLTVEPASQEKLFALDLTDEVIAELVGAERSTCMRSLSDVREKARHEDEERRKRARVQNPLFGATLAGLDPAIGNMYPSFTRIGLGPGEDRSQAEYERQVERHILDYQASLAEVSLTRLVETGAAQVCLTVVNPTERHIPAVRVTALIDGPVFVDADDRETEMPSRPRPFGTSPLSAMDDLILRSTDLSLDLSPPNPAPSTVEVQRKAGVEIRWPPTEIPPLGRVELDPVSLGIFPPPDSDALGVTWSATSSGFDGVVTGSIRLVTEAVVPATSNLSKVLHRR